MIPQNPWLWPSAADGITIAPRIARPPSSGVGRWCMRRSSTERSTMPVIQANCDTTGVSSTASRNATAKPTTAA